jgi:hypothetical protein
VVDELTPGAFSEAVFPHHQGFGVVIAAPPEGRRSGRSIHRAGDRPGGGLGRYRRPAYGARYRRGHQDLPAGAADAIVEVLSLDIASFRATVRALARLLATRSKSERRWL